MELTLDFSYAMAVISKVKSSKDAIISPTLSHVEVPKLQNILYIRRMDEKIALVNRQYWDLRVTVY